MRPAFAFHVLLVLVALTLPACGSDDPGSAGSSPEATVRSYVEALDERDGERFCDLLAPYISGRIEMAGRDPEGLLRGRMGCGQLVSTFIGYIEDCCPPKFLHASVKELSVGGERDGLMPVKAKVDVLEEDTETHRKRTEHLDDTVWLARFGGEWRVAKMSALAHLASVGLGEDSDDVLSPPDVPAEKLRFESELAQFRGHQRARRASYVSPGKLADCSGGLVVEDRTDGSQALEAGQLDLRRLTVRVRNGVVCLEYELSGAVEGPAEFVFNLRDSAAGSRFIQLFHTELRRDGSARVTSGQDDDEHPIPVPAQIGREGNRLTVVLDRASFEGGEPTAMSSGDPPLRRFVFMASVGGAAPDGHGVQDSLGPDSPQLPYSYPDGKPCGLDRC